MPTDPEDSQPDEPHSRSAHFARNGQHITEQKPGFFKRALRLFKPEPDPTLRETIEEYIEEEPNGKEHDDSIAQHEKELFANLLQLRDLRADDVMIPRADIIAIDVNTTQKELYELLKDKQHSRIPVYKETLDEVLGTIHLKDLLADIAQGKKIKIKDMISDLPIVAPSMSVLDLLLEMRRNKRHMVLVVDEYGGIDGLITIGDIIEELVGEIEDEHDLPDEADQITEYPDGTLLVDARLDIDEFEDKYGNLITPEEKEESETLGGLVSAIAGRVPVRGEVLTHKTGMVFEIMDADPRRIHRLKIRNIPTHLG